MEETQALNSGDEQGPEPEPEPLAVDCGDATEGSSMFQAEALEQAPEKAKKLEDRAARQIRSTQASGAQPDNQDEERFIHPNKPFRTAWDVALMGLILYVSYAEPLRLGFAASVDSCGFWFSFDIFVDVVFATDIVLNLKTAYFDEHTGELVHKSAEIRRNYLCGWLFWDFISVLPVSYIGGCDGTSPGARGVRVLKLLRLGKLLRLARIKRIMDRTVWNIPAELLRGFAVGKAMVITLVLSHFVACLWHYIGVPESGCDASGSHTADGNCEPTWFDGNIAPDATLGARYLTCFYWAATTLSTVGYGDITPSGNAEKLMAIVVQLIGTCVFAYTAGILTSIVMESKTNPKIVKYSENIAMVKEYLRRKNIHKADPSLFMAILRQVDAKFHPMNSTAETVDADSALELIDDDHCMAIFQKSPQYNDRLQLLQNSCHSVVTQIEQGILHESTFLSWGKSLGLRPGLGRNLVKMASNNGLMLSPVEMQRVPWDFGSEDRGRILVDLVRRLETKIFAGDFEMVMQQDDQLRDYFILGRGCCCILRDLQPNVEVVVDTTRQHNADFSNTNNGLRRGMIVETGEHNSHKEPNGLRYNVQFFKTRGGELEEFDPINDLYYRRHIREVVTGHMTDDIHHSTWRHQNARDWFVHYIVDGGTDKLKTMGKAIDPLNRNERNRVDNHLEGIGDAYKFSSFELHRGDSFGFLAAAEVNHCSPRSRCGLTVSTLPGDGAEDPEVQILTLKADTIKELCENHSSFKDCWCVLLLEPPQVIGFVSFQTSIQSLHSLLLKAQEKTRK